MVIGSEYSFTSETVLYKFALAFVILIEVKTSSPFTLNIAYFLTYVKSWSITVFISYIILIELLYLFVLITKKDNSQ